MRKLLHGTVLIVVGVADGNQRRVPRPLVRVEVGSRLGVLPVPVEVQHHLGLLDELLIRFLHRVRLLLLKSPTQSTLTWAASSTRDLAGQIGVGGVVPGRHNSSSPNRTCGRGPAS